MHEDAATDPDARRHNLSVLLQGLEAYYGEELGMQILLELPVVPAIVCDPASGGLRELCVEPFRPAMALKRPSRARIAPSVPMCNCHGRLAYYSRQSAPTKLFGLLFKKKIKIIK